MTGAAQPPDLPADASGEDEPSTLPDGSAVRARRAVLLRLDPAVHHALQRWAADDLRSLNAHIELLLRAALADAGRAPHGAGPIPRRGRPPGQGRRSPQQTRRGTEQSDRNHDGTDREDADPRDVPEGGASADPR